MHHSSGGVNDICVWMWATKLCERATKFQKHNEIVEEEENGEKRSQEAEKFLEIY